MRGLTCKESVTLKGRAAVGGSSGRGRFKKLAGDGRGGSGRDAERVVHGMVDMSCSWIVKDVVVGRENQEGLFRRDSRRRSRRKWRYGHTVAFWKVYIPRERPVQARISSQGARPGCAGPEYAERSQMDRSGVCSVWEGSAQAAGQGQIFVVIGG